MSSFSVEGRPLLKVSSFSAVGSTLLKEKLVAGLLSKGDILDGSQLGM